SRRRSGAGGPKADPARPRARPPRPRPAAEQTSPPGPTPPDYQQLFRELVARANDGDREALARLRKFLDLNPHLWERAGDLTAVAERAWIELVAGQDQLVAESVRRRLARLKADLGGPHATPLEFLLIDQVAVTWLA